MKKQHPLVSSKTICLETQNSIGNHETSVNPQGLENNDNSLKNKVQKQE
jgi:hypothetical protein